MGKQTLGNTWLPPGGKLVSRRQNPLGPDLYLMHSGQFVVTSRIWPGTRLGCWAHAGRRWDTSSAAPAAARQVRVPRISQGLLTSWWMV